MKTKQLSSATTTVRIFRTWIFYIVVLSLGSSVLPNNAQAESIFSELKPIRRQFSSREVQRINFELFQLRHYLIRKKPERVHGFRMLQRAKRELTQERVRARLGRDGLDLTRDGFR